MALKEYAKKRKFSKTPEPKGGQPEGEGFLRFVVQKHQASSLHYDFRLEVGGVLKSWAVPKGPSTNPQDKHLAMMVEDHPFDYRNFEGVIPEGNYGAGQVIIWDEGVYVSRHATDRKGSEKEMRGYIEQGHVVIILSGKKLKGEYALIKIKDSKDPNAWLLIKAGDQYASKDDITKQDKSVRSGLTVEDLAKDPTGLLTAPKGKLPTNVKPMLATLVEEAFNDDDWVFEVKWDGYRAIAETGGKKVKLYSRNLQPFESKFASIVENLSQIKHKAVLDGEVVALVDGKPSFQAIQDYANQQGSLVYYVFDILYLDGKDLTKMPLTHRKEILKSILPKTKQIQLSDHVEGDGKSFFKAAQDQMLEGIMAKKKSGTYQSGKRSKEWLKIKTHMRQEAVIGGFTEPRGGRKLFGALILGVYEDGKLVHIGQTGGGFDGASLKAVHGKMKALVSKDCPFETAPKTMEKAT